MLDLSRSGIYELANLETFKERNSHNRFEFTPERYVGDTMSLLVGSSLFVGSGGTLGQISSIPSWLSEACPMLRELHLGGNNLEEMPQVLFGLSELRTLFLQNNQIAAIPRDIAKLTQLRKLDLSGNNIATLPITLRSLEHLTWLALVENQFSIPPEILTNADNPESILRFPSIEG